MKKTLSVLVLATLVGCSRGEERARNVILFIGDAGGIPTLHAASVHAYREPQALFIQKMPSIALMETSAADAWVTDSAAGMTAIVTGHKTDNGVISQSDAAVRGKVDGAVLKTILEHAEERGLSTGVVTDMNITDATAAACYAHSNNRSKTGEIFGQLTKPRFGDGADVVVGSGRTAVLTATNAMGMDIEAALREKGYTVLDSPAAVNPDAKRIVALTDNRNYDPLPVLEGAVRILSANPKGYFLMVEWDMHTDQLRAGLERALVMDKLVRRATELGGNDTLVIFAADHSFDIRVRGGSKDEPLLKGEELTAAAAEQMKQLQTTAQHFPAPRGNVRVDDGHTGEQVLVAAQGPGANRVRGYIQNTDLFHIMMAAYGWERWDGPHP